VGETLLWSLIVTFILLVTVTIKEVNVVEYVKKYATEQVTNEQIKRATNEGATCMNGGDKSDESESSLSDFSEDEAQDMEL